MELIKWGIISTGNIAHSFTQDFKFTNNGKIMAVASRSKEKASRFASQYNIPKAYGKYDELFKDNEIDAIYVATPHNFHFDNTSNALKTGKAVLCEKPITVNPKECQELMDLSQTTGNYLMEGMWTYFLPAILKAQEWVTEGKIGAIKHVKADFGNPVPFEPASRMYNPELAGGALLDMGIYPVALAWLFLKRDPDNISVLSRKAPTGVDDDVIMMFDYDDAAATLATSFQCKLPNCGYIIGDKGYIRIPDFWKAKECFLYNSIDKCEEHYVDDRKSQGFNFEIEAMNNDLLENKMESDVMPLSYSLKLQEHINMVMKKF